MAKPATKDARRETNRLLPDTVEETGQFHGGFRRCAWIGPMEHPSKPGIHQR